jgi:hypothetical protein
MGAEENAVQNGCIEYLARVPGVLKVGRLNNNAVFDKKENVHRAFGKYAMLGLADIQVLAKPGVLPAGTLGVIEAKTWTGTTSPEQKDYLTVVAASGNTAVLARSLAELVQVIERRIQPEAETGVYLPSGLWRLTKSKAKVKPPVYGSMGRWGRR